MATQLDLREQEQLDDIKAFWSKWGNLITWTLTLVLAGFAGSTADAATLKVGPGRALNAPSAAAAVAKDGDTVLIDAGTYSGDRAELTGTALVGKRSLAVRLTFQKLVDI